MTTLRSLVALFALFGSFAAVACDAPAAVDIPSGAEASLDDMLAAQAGVRDYMAAMDEYLTCMDAAIEALGEEATEEERVGMVDAYNAGVDQMEETAADFNEQRVAFQEKAAEEN